MKHKIIFLGSPDFSIPSLECLVEDSRFEVVAVFSQPDKKVGRKQILTPSDVKKRALELGLKVYTPESINTPENVAIIRDLQPDFLFTVAYGQIISPEILKIPKIEAINLHGSLLPKYRGASPIQTSLLNGDLETGISFIRMVAKMDAGEIFFQTKIKIAKTDNAGSLFGKMSELSRKITADVLDKIAKGELKAEKQDEKNASYCKKISKNEGEIDWQNETAEEIYNKIRAYTPWPSCYTKFQNKTLKILQADFIKVPLHKGDTGGFVFVLPLEKGDTGGFLKDVHITAKSGSILPQIVQLEGKKPLTIQEFIKGKPEFLNSTVGS